MIYSKTIACGGYLPKKCLTNDDLARMVDTSNEWIVQRTGIRMRYIADKGEGTSDLAYQALMNALETHGIIADSLDGIIVATATADQNFPSTAALVHKKLATNKSMFVMDVNAVCAGFVYALVIADGLIKSGNVNRIAVIGADVFSRIIDWSDRKTCVLFGDGAGALILEKSKDPGIQSSYISGDGQCANILESYRVEGALTSVVQMNGKEVFKKAVEKMSDAVTQVLKLSNIKAEDIDFFVPHQANQRIIDSIAQRLNVPKDKMISTIAKHGNTSAATIPLAIWDSLSSGIIKYGDSLILTALGGGLTWGAVQMIL